MLCHAHRSYRKSIQLSGAWTTASWRRSPCSGPRARQTSIAFRWKHSRARKSPREGRPLTRRWLEKDGRMGIAARTSKASKSAEARACAIMVDSP